MSEEFDIELFINEIEKFPEIWNIASEAYHSRQKKRAAWTSVCRVFNEGFEEQKDKVKNDICNKFIQKWKNIKDTYIKSEKKKLKSGQAAFSGKRYVYARQLSFLQVAGATTETQSSLSNKDVKTSVEQPEPHNNTSQSEASPSPPLYKLRASKKRKRDFINAPIHPNTPEINSDRSFFESILPFISGFTKDQKLEFRSEILNIIRRMRTQPNSHQSAHVANVLHYQPTQTSSRNFTPQQINQCPIETPTSTAQTSNMGDIGHLSPALSSSTVLDIQTYKDEDTLDIFKD